MSGRASPKHWVIEVWDGLKPLYETRVRFGMLTESQVAALLRTLVARYGEYTGDEIVKAMLKRGSKDRSTLLEVRRSYDAKNYMLSCDGGVLATAKLDPWTNPLVALGVSPGASAWETL